ncbi:MAG: acyl carrier protein [Actinobacteria bacterium]|nr:acyl carrier protein [Actinomycetota bacterium]
MPEPLTTVIRLLEEVTGVPAENLDDATRFESLHPWTSLSALQLLTALEDRLDIRLDLRAYLSATTVRDVVSLVADSWMLAREEPC